jgi:hypothetical protein
MFIETTTEPLNTADQAAAEDPRAKLPSIIVNECQPRELLEEISGHVEESNDPPTLFTQNGSLVLVSEVRRCRL